MLDQKVPGRWCDIHGVKPVTELKYGQDFREPRFRREVFLRFYEFHLKYRAHPGGVYYAMPYLADTQGLGKEQRYWLAYINGCSQNIVTTWRIFQEFPSLKFLDLEKFDNYFRKHYDKFGWDTDRRYVKNSFPKCVADYRKQLGGQTQEEYFEAELGSDQYENFRKTWDKVISNFFLFGRLSTFSYLEYLRILGLNIDCDQLFLEDLDGSKSHRNGLCKVLGRDDLDWHDKLNPDFQGYTPEIIEWLKLEGHLLLEEARGRISHQDVSYFTLESTLCNYKSWHRKNRRYPNVYNDMFHDRIKYAEGKWQERINIFWDARRAYLPKHLRLEDNPGDPGVCPEKQNHYRETGQPIMMDQDWPCFKNDFNDRISSSNNLESLFEPQ